MTNEFMSNNNQGDALNPNTDIGYQKEQRSDDKRQHPSKPSKRGFSKKQRSRSESNGQQASSTGGFKHADSNLVPTFRQGRWVKESIMMETDHVAARLCDYMEKLAKRQNYRTAINTVDNMRVFKFGMYAMIALSNHEVVAFDPATIRVPEVFMPFWSHVRPMSNSKDMVQIDLEQPEDMYFDEFGRFAGFIELTEPAEALLAKERMGEKLSKEETEAVTVIRALSCFNDSRDEVYFNIVDARYIRGYINDELTLYFGTTYGLPAHSPSSTTEIFNITIDEDGRLLSLPSVIPTGTAMAIRAAFKFIELSKLFGPHNFALSSLDDFEDYIRSHVLLNMINTRPDNLQA